MTKVPILTYNKIAELEELLTVLLKDLQKELNPLKLREKYEEFFDEEDKENLSNVVFHLKEEDYEMIYNKIEKWSEKMTKFVKKNVKEFLKEQDSKIIVEEESVNLKHQIEEKMKSIMQLNDKVIF